MIRDSQVNEGVGKPRAWISDRKLGLLQLEASKEVREQLGYDWITKTTVKMKRDNNLKRQICKALKFKTIQFMRSTDV